MLINLNLFIYFNFKKLRFNKFIKWIFDINFIVYYKRCNIALFECVIKFKKIISLIDLLKH